MYTLSKTTCSDLQPALLIERKPLSSRLYHGNGVGKKLQPTKSPQLVPISHRSANTVAAVTSQPTIIHDSYVKCIKGFDISKKNYCNEANRANNKDKTMPSP
uniref:Teneurin-2 n=1 Tax=Lygus hesperus TaxID=30085 RepID=A0A0A9X7M6_LYGHE